MKSLKLTIIASKATFSPGFTKNHILSSLNTPAGIKIKIFIPTGAFCLSILVSLTCHKEIAPTGQTAVQAPHSTHVSLISAFCSTIQIASTGQTAIHCPQPIQLSFSTCAFKKTTPYLLIFLMGSARILMLMFLTNNIIRNQISL